MMSQNVLYSCRFYIYQKFLFIIIRDEVYIYLQCLFNLFLIFIYLFIYLFIRNLYLVEVMLLDWLIKSTRSIINILFQIVNFQKVLNVSDMECCMYLSMFRQLNVYNIVEEPGRIYLAGTLELPTFISKLLVFMGHTLAYKKSSRKF